MKKNTEQEMKEKREIEQVYRIKKIYPTLFHSTLQTIHTVVRVFSTAVGVFATAMGMRLFCRLQKSTKPPRTLSVWDK